MSIRELLKISTHGFIILFLAFTVLPVKLNYSSMAIIVLLVLALINLFYTGPSKFRDKYKFLILAIPLLVYLLGLINTQNLNSGLSFVTRNLSFIAFPIIILSLGDFFKKSLIFRAYLILLIVIDLYLIYLFIYYFNFGESFTKNTGQNFIEPYLFSL